MDDIFKSKTFTEVGAAEVKTTTLEQISKCPPVAKAKAPSKPKIAPRKENKQRPYKLPAKEDGPGTEAAFARWENPIDLQNYIEEAPSTPDAFDALLGKPRRNAGGDRESRNRQSGRSGRGGSRRRSDSRSSDSTRLEQLARELRFDQALGSNDPGPPPPFRGL